MAPPPPVNRPATTEETRFLLTMIIHSTGGPLHNFDWESIARDLGAEDDVYGTIARFDALKKSLGNKAEKEDWTKYSTKELERLSAAQSAQRSAVDEELRLRIAIRQGQECFKKEQEQERIDKDAQDGIKNAKEKIEEKQGALKQPQKKDERQTRSRSRNSSEGEFQNLQVAAFNRPNHPCANCGRDNINTHYKGPGGRNMCSSCNNRWRKDGFPERWENTAVAAAVAGGLVVRRAELPAWLEREEKMGRDDGERKLKRGVEGEGTEGKKVKMKREEGV